MIKGQSEFESPFAMKGDELRNGFAKRFGGGYVGASDIMSSFKMDTEDIVKNIIGSDTKDINNMISSAINDKIGEATQEPASTYAKSSDATNTTNTPGFSAPFNLDSIQEAIQKTYNSGAQDPTIQNAAAALSTTDSGITNGLDGLMYNPDLMNFDPGNLGFSPTIPSIIPDTLPDNILEQLQQQPIEPSTLPTIDQPPIQEPPPTVKDVGTTSAINQQFNDTLDEMFDEIEDIQVMGQTQSDAIDDISDEIESINVNGNTLTEEIEDISVDGKTDQKSLRKVEKDVEQLTEDSEDDSNDPWEKFKALYADFYGGKNAGAILREVKARENGYGPSDLEPTPLNGMSSDTRDILNAKKEKDDLRASSMNRNQKQTDKSDRAAPIIINNNKAITAKTSDNKTGRVFADESTFNRLSTADSNHPQYMGYGR
jgi:hypothetical protein